MAIVKPDTIKFKSLNELKEGIDMGLDILFYINDILYNIGGTSTGYFIAICPEQEVEYRKWEYKDAEDMLNNHKVNGKALKEIWQDIDLYSM